MRKKLKMRAGGKVAKYAEGGRVGGPRPQEDRARMAADAAAGFDAEEERVMARRAARAQASADREAANARAREAWRGGQSAITNRPVGGAPAAAARPLRESGPRMSDAGGQPAMPESLPTPPIPPARRRAVGRRTSADDLNEREMTRILNERSLEAARAGRNMFRKGGRVSAKKK